MSDIHSGRWSTTTHGSNALRQRAEHLEAVRQERELGKHGRRRLKVRSMTKVHNRFCGLWVAAAGAMLLSAAPCLGQSVLIPCSAFARHTYGWKVLAPVMLDIDGRLFGPMVGTTMTVGPATNGGKLNEVLDRECGNRRVYRPERPEAQMDVRSGHRLRRLLPVSAIASVGIEVPAENGVSVHRK